MQLPPEDFERRIFIKQNAAWLLEQELRQVRAHEEIALGTATDPYQPVERRAKVTQSLLEVLARQHGLRIGVVTKSTLIERDIRFAAENRGEKYAGAAPDDYYPECRIGSAA